jgi:hypothetical protein
MTVKEIFDAFGTTLKEDLQQSLRNKGIEYDGGDSRLSASIKFRYSENNGNPSFNLSMNDYWEALNDGRGANKKAPPIDPIINWIKRKGIFTGISLKRKEKFRIAKVGKTKAEVKQIKKLSREDIIKNQAFAISRSIGKKGFKGNHFVDELLNDGRLTQLRQDVSKALGKEIFINFNKAA